MYADDTVLIANNATNLQKQLDSLSNYCTTWKLKCNSSKTKVMVFGKRKLNDELFILSGEPMEIGK